MLYVAAVCTLCETDSQKTKIALRPANDCKSVDRDKIKPHELLVAQWIPCMNTWKDAMADETRRLNNANRAMESEFYSMLMHRPMRWIISTPTRSSVWLLYSYFVLLYFLFLILWFFDIIVFSMSRRRKQKKFFFKSAHHSQCYISNVEINTRFRAYKMMTTKALRGLILKQV